VFVSSTLQELAPERRAVRDAVLGLRLIPVMIESAARPHAPRDLYQAYLAESQLFVGVYWQSDGGVPGDGDISAVEDEFRLADKLPRLVYVKEPAPDREPRLDAMLAGMRRDARISYRHFATAEELRQLVRDDIALLLSEQFGTDAPEPAAVPAAVPAPPSPILGRDTEIERLERLLTDPGVRLVTLTGPGGVGKTRLATELATMLAGSYPDGVRFVGLSAVTAPDLVGAALAQALGLHTTVGRPPIDDVAAYLRTRGLLLVIDNFEQVAEAAPAISTLLSAAPGVTVLVTSRAPLRLTGEHTAEVPPLPLPDPDSDYRDDARTGAVGLFVARARAARQDFALTPESTEAVIEICRRLDGLPLAIELAAAKIRVLPPATLLDRLREGVGTLSGGARDLPARQRTMRSTIAWSHDLLTPGQRVLFCRLGVFTGGVDLAAIEAIPESDVLDTLDALVANSLVQQEVHDGQPRFRMLESIREYALEQLRDSGRWHEAHADYAAYFLDLAQRLEPFLGIEPSAIERLETEHDNLNAVMNWFLDEREWENAIDLGWAIWGFWWLHGHVEEGARYMYRVADEARDLSAAAAASLGVGTGALAFVSGDIGRAEPDLTASRATLDAIGDERNTALVTGILGIIAMQRHDFDRARELLEEVRRLGERSGADWLRSLYYSRMGLISLRDGDTEAAARIFREGLETARRSHDRLGTVTGLYSLAVTVLADGDADSADGYLREGMARSAEAGDRGSVVFHLEALADLAARKGRYARAVRLTAAAQALRTSSAAAWLEAYVPDWPTGHGGVPVLRGHLGDQEFADAWARGSADDIRSAVEFAMADG
jgi:predicted ATPase